MFAFIRGIFGGAKDDAARLAYDRAAQEAEAARRRAQSIRIITGDIRHRYAIVDTLSAVGFYEADPRGLVDPEEATRRANALLQEQAVRVDADAVVHAQYHVLRYTLQRRQYVFTPVYETHVFGTAVKIIGPPESA